MLPGGTDPLYRAALAAGHRRYTRVEVWSGLGVRLDEAAPAHLRGEQDGGIAWLDGTVTATLGSRVARNLRLSVPGALYPRSTSDLLAPFGNELRVYSGIRFGDGSTPYVWQVFRGRIGDVELSDSGDCQLRCSDRAADVQDAGFVSPMNSLPGNSVNAEWQRLIVDGVPDATFGVSDVLSDRVKALTWEWDRASALDEMTRSAGALWYPLANGDFVIRRFPWAVASPPVVLWSDRESLNRWRVRRSRDSIFNVVTMTGERLNGDPPVYATAMDNTPGSPTRVGGNFGVRSRLERLQTPSTPGGVASAAEALLRTYIAPTEEWVLELVPDPALELGDVGTVEAEDLEAIQVATSFNLPLAHGNMTVSTRSLVVGGEL